MSERHPTKQAIEFLDRGSGIEESVAPVAIRGMSTAHIIAIDPEHERAEERSETALIADCVQSAQE